jgi:hypothetical protein
MIKRTISTTTEQARLVAYSLLLYRLAWVIAASHRSLNCLTPGLLDQFKPTLRLPKRKYRHRFHLTTLAYRIECCIIQPKSRGFLVPQVPGVKTKKNLVFIPKACFTQSKTGMHLCQSRGSTKRFLFNHTRDWRVFSNRAWPGQGWQHRSAPTRRRRSSARLHQRTLATTSRSGALPPCGGTDRRRCTCCRPSPGWCR